MNPTDPHYRPSDRDKPRCQYCAHSEHGTERCSECRCKGKARWWQKVASGLGNAVGESLFGGDR